MNNPQVQFLTPSGFGIAHVIVPSYWALDSSLGELQT